MTRFQNVGVFIREKVWLETSLSQTFSHINTPTFWNLVILHIYPPMKMEQSVLKRRHIKFRRRGITQKKAYNIQNKEKVWSQDHIPFLAGLTRDINTHHTRRELIYCYFQMMNFFQYSILTLFSGSGPQSNAYRQNNHPHSFFNDETNVKEIGWESVGSVFMWLRTRTSGCALVNIVLNHMVP
jgi:hypothetical protein